MSRALRIGCGLLALLAVGCRGPRAGDPWTAELWGDGREFGRYRAHLTLDTSGERLSGGSRHGALSNLKGGWLVALHGLLSRHGGSLFDVDASTPLAPGGKLEVSVAFPLGELVFEGVWSPAGFEGVWLGKGDPLLGGGFRWSPDPVRGEGPLDDYPAILEALVSALGEHYVFPGRLSTEAWLEAVAAARERVGWVRDDLEFLVLGQLLLAELGTSATAVVRHGEKPTSDEPFEVRFEGDVAVVRMPFFEASVEDIDLALGEASDARALILDLRGSGGIDLSSARVLAYLSPASRPIGIMVTRRFAERWPPTPAKRDAVALQVGVYDFQLYRLALLSRGIVAAASEELDPGERFQGPVAVLVDGATSGAAEPVAAFLQDEGLATIVGEPTAGAMLDAELFDLPAGWRAAIPIGAYFTWGGRLLEGSGVEPDVGATPQEALGVALRLLGEAPAP